MSIAKQRTDSVVTEPQEKEKGKLRKATFDSTMLVLFCFYWSNFADGFEQMLVIMVHAVMG